MAKPKLKDFKTYLDSLDEAEVREELFKLFGKLSQVQEFYAQELMSDTERKAMLEEYKAKIHKQFWTKGGNPRSPSNAEIRALISSFEKVSVFPTELIDLLLYQVETATEFANEFGGMPDADYNASYNAFKKAVELIVKHKLEDMYHSRCLEIFNYENLDYYYIDDLKGAFHEHFKQ